MKLLNLAFPFLVIASLSSCGGCKDVDVNVPGGKGGNGTLNVNLRHHDTNIDSAGMVYISYGLDAPGDGKYADSAKCATVNSQHYASFANLRKGQYYLYGKGFDKKAGEMIGGGNGFVLHEETNVDYVLGISTHLDK